MDVGYGSEQPVWNHSRMNQYLIEVEQVEEPEEVTDHPLLRNNQKWEVAVNHPLKELLRRTPKTFYCEGESYWNNFEHIILVQQKDNKEVYIDCGSIFNPKVEILLEAARPSSFGKGTETVYDETIRKGKELTAEDIYTAEKMNISTYWYDKYKPSESNIGRSILFHLPENIHNKALKAKFYKLAIYEPGGHFHTHRDTVHGPDHIATLLVEVRSAHKGGDLIVEKDGERHVWSTETSGAKAQGISWCFFYTDIEHRVEPVLEGVRMVLQYDILLNHDGYPIEVYDEENDGNYDIIGRTQPIDTHPSLVGIEHEAVNGIISYLQTHLMGKNALAIPFFYFYANQKIAPRHLKNADAILFGELVKAGLSVALTPVQLHARTYFDKFARSLPITMEIGDYPLIFYSPFESVDAVNSEGYKRKMLSSWPRDISLTYVHSGIESSAFLSTEVFQSTVGNEPINEGENHYFTGAMIIIKEADVMIGKEKKSKTDEKDNAKRSHQSNDTCEGSLSDRGK